MDFSAQPTLAGQASTPPPNIKKKKVPSELPIWSFLLWGGKPSTRLKWFHKTETPNSTKVVILRCLANHNQLAGLFCQNSEQNFVLRGTLETTLRKQFCGGRCWNAAMGCPQTLADTNSEETNVSEGIVAYLLNKSIFHFNYI